MHRILAVALASVFLLSGCASTENGDPAPTTSGPLVHGRLPTPPDQMPEGGSHDHADPAQHQFLFNYEFSDRDPLMSNQVNSAGLHAMDLQNGYLFGAIYGSHAVSVDGGMQIWDVHTDPAHPQPLGKWTIPGSVGGDRSIGATSDGNFVVIGLEPVDCLGHVNPFGAAVNAYLLDVTDKSLPIVADVVTAGGGTIGAPTAVAPKLGQHSVFVHKIGNIDYAFLFGDIYRIDISENLGAKLVYVAGVPTGHDLYVRDTPWNTTWALTANGSGNGALEIWDITDPTQPFQIGIWNKADPDPGYYYHTADVDFIGNQTLVMLASEDFGPHVSPFWLFDGNGLRSVERGEEAIELDVLGSWSNPWNHTAANIRFSLHNQRFHDDGIMTITSYHAGFFQFDLRYPEFWAEPSLIASAAYADATGVNAARDPIEAQNDCGLAITNDAPEFMDPAIGQNGILYMADAFMGLYTFVPSSTHPVYGGGPTATMAPVSPAPTSAPHSHK